MAQHTASERPRWTLTWVQVFGHTVPCHHAMKAAWAHRRQRLSHCDDGIPSPLASTPRPTEKTPILFLPDDSPEELGPPPFLIQEALLVSSPQRAEWLTPSITQFKPNSNASLLSKPAKTSLSLVICLFTKNRVDTQVLGHQALLPPASRAAARPHPPEKSVFLLPVHTHSQVVGRQHGCTGWG